MNEDIGSVTKAIQTLHSHSLSNEACLSNEAAQLLWERYFQKLCGFVEGHIYARNRRKMSSDEIACDAFMALLDGVLKGRFEKVRNRDELWQMLTLIASRRTINAQVKVDRPKHGSGKVFGESAFGSSGLNNLVDFVQRDLGPQDAVMLQDLSQRLLDCLPNEQARRVALLRLAGYSNAEIAKEIERTERTVESKLSMIREVWSKVLEE